MSLEFRVGDRSISVSGAIMASGLFRTVYRHLEKNKRGSQYPYFHELDKQERFISWKNARILQEELYVIKRKLAVVPYPVALYYIKEMEFRYVPKIGDEGEISGNEYEIRGVDERGLFVAPGGSLLGPIFQKKHFQEMKRRHKYFDDFVRSCTFHEEQKRKIDHIIHGWKSAGTVFNH